MNYIFHVEHARILTIMINAIVSIFMKIRSYAAWLNVSSLAFEYGTMARKSQQFASGIA